MSEITLNVLDAERAICGRVHGGVADRLVASLAADPETIEELELALARYERRLDGGVFRAFHRGVDREPWDAGIVFIDLTARLVASQSSYSTFLREGCEWWHDGESFTDHELPFHLADEWSFTDDLDSFERLSAARRATRLAQEPVDQRAVLYGRLPEFLASQVHERRHRLKRLTDDARHALVRDIHSAWLMTPRDDLRGCTPREVMIDDRHEHIARDLEDQSVRWSILREQPQGLRRESAAYRFGGFGTKELVLYYNLVRELLHECVTRFKRRPVPADGLPAEAEHLQRLRQDWMNGPNDEVLGGRTPASVIDRERRRIPEVMTAQESIVDPDCPICRAMAEDEQFGPAFLCLDGCNMDDDFEFSFHRTREEWEDERRRWEEFNREFEEKRKEHGGEWPDEMPF